MKISKVTTAIKVADVVKNNKKTEPRIVFDYKNYQSKETLTSTLGRVYLLVSDGVIKKIGYSQDKGGIKGTLSAYQGGMGGRPSIRTMGIHLLLNEEVKNSKKVEVHMILASSKKMKVKGLFSEEIVDVSPTIEMETLCKEQYLAKEGKYPEWNIQETEGKEWEDWIKKRHAKRMRDSLKKK